MEDGIQWRIYVLRIYLGNWVSVQTLIWFNHQKETMFIFSLSLLVVYLVSVQCVAPISVFANVKGRKYEIVAESIGQFTKRIEAKRKRDFISTS
jgi:hypothetical protein